MRSTIDFLKDVFFLVEADSFATMVFWERNQARKKPMIWQQEVGMWETIGRLADMPVSICMMPVRISGKRIIFWELISQVQDCRMVEPYFERNNCKPRCDNGTRPATTNADNFQHCIHAIEESLQVAYGSSSK